MPSYRLTLEYEGTRYHGWQEQPNARTVAGALKTAIVDAGAGVKELVGSGRTDAGVHALAQVAHLRLARNVDPARFRRDVNDRLPADIHIVRWEEVSSNFHARHSAELRSYLYQISRRRSAFAKRFVWWVKRPLGHLPMQECAALLAGRHDFQLFCEQPAEQTSTVVVVESAEIVEAGDLLLFRIVASHFLWKMVRRLAGTLVSVGAGELSPAGFRSLLEGRVPRSGPFQPAEVTAPPSGLFLERVLYPGEPGLAPIAPAFPVSGEDEAD